MGLLTLAATPRETMVRRLAKAMQQLDKQQEQPPVVRPQAQLCSPMDVSSRMPCRRTSMFLRARSSRQ